MRVKYGTYVGNGSSPHSITGIGFNPNLVIIDGNISTDGRFKTSDMSGLNSSWIRQNTALDTTGILSLDSSGFTVGSVTSVNNNGTNYYYIAILNDGVGDFTTFTYTGTGASHAITLGWQPVFVLTRDSSSANPACFRFSTQTGDATSVSFGSADTTGAITSISSTGFVTGTNSKANGSGLTYYGFAFGSSTNKAYCVDFTGNGTSQSVISVPFQPGWTLIKANAGVSPNLATSAFPATDSTAFDSAFITTGLQPPFSPHTFSVGTSTTANDNAQTMHSFSLYDPAYFPNFFPFFLP